MTDIASGSGKKPILFGIFKSNADAFKIGTAYLIGTAGVVYCFYAAATDGTDHVLQSLICILGGAIGWCIGLYFTPNNEGEKEQLSEASKALLTLASGFGLGKIDRINRILSQLFPGDSSHSALLVLLFLSMLVIGALFTYVSRLFVRGDDGEPHRERAQAIEEVKKAVKSLDNLV